MSDRRTRYVIGFAFTMDRTRVALIRKDHPEWQAGKLNGVGGKIEAGETPLQAMVREFEEEAGVNVPAERWERVARMEGTDNDGWPWDVAVFATRLAPQEWADLHSPTSERVERHYVPLMSALNVIHNLRFLVPLAADPKRPEATFDYTGVEHAKEAASQDKRHHGSSPPTEPPGGSE